MNDLIALYQQRLNLQNAIFSRIDHDDAMVAIVYKITQAGGLNLILKICTRPISIFSSIIVFYFFIHSLIAAFFASNSIKLIS